MEEFLKSSQQTPRFTDGSTKAREGELFAGGSQHTLEAEGAAARWLVPTPFLTESAFCPPGEDSPPLLPPLYPP